MKTNRRKFSADEKVKIIRKHLIEKVPISEVCDQHGIKPTLNRRHTDFQTGKCDCKYLKNKEI